MDFEPEEIKRNVTIQLGIAPCEWQGYKLNFIDTPGYSEFCGEVRAALRAADGILMVVSADAGVEMNHRSRTGLLSVWNFTAAHDLRQ